MNIIKMIDFYVKIIGRKFYLILIFSVILGLMETLTVAALNPLIKLLSDNEFYLFGRSINIKEYLYFFVFLLLIKTALTHFYYRKVSSIRGSYYQIVKSNIISRILGDNFENIRAFDNGKVINIFSEQAVNSMLGLSNLALLFLNLNLFLMFLMFLLYTSWEIFLVLILAGVFLVLFFINVNKEMKKKSVVISDENKSISNDLLDILVSLKYLRSTNKTDFIQGIIDKKIKLNKLREIQVYNHHGLIQTIKDPLIILVMSLIIAYSYIKGLAFEQLLLIVVVLYKVITSLITLQSSIQKTYSLVGSIKEIEELIHETSFFESKKSRNISIAQMKNQKSKISINEIKLKNINYSINGKVILKNLNIDITKNSKLAIVGPSGSGKSTIINIMLGLLYPDSGHVYINQMKTSAEELSGFRDCVGLVNQDQCLFAMSLKENITFGEKFDEFKYKNIIESCDLSKLIKKLPDNDDTKLVNNGSNFSGGEKQKIFLARELYSDREIIVLDEPTAAMDKESEQKVLNIISKLKKTLIIITHSQSVKSVCDSFIELRKYDEK